MKLALLLYPHQNIRYRASLLQIALEETKLVFSALGVETEIDSKKLGGSQFLFCLPVRPLSRWEMGFLWHLSSVYMIFEMNENALVPLDDQRPDYIGEDLPYLLKYKGKTNEMFTDSMLTMALAASDFSHNYDAQLTVLDPLAGKGTTLLLALRRGYHGIGIEVSKSCVEELAGYMNRYFEFHKMKYKYQKSSLTVYGKNGGIQHKWLFSDSADHFRDGDTRSMRMICGDTRNTASFIKTGSVHLLVTDLPYGVQMGTAGKTDGILDTVSSAVPGWYSVLKKGGCLCMSFNTHTVHRDVLAGRLAECGFSVVDTGTLAHWVEQAIERDLIIARKD